MTDLGERRGVDTDVYEPAEDSQLLASVCVDEIHSDDRVVDVGTGTGFLAGRICVETGAIVVGVDVNPVACQRAAADGVPVVRGDLVSAIAPVSVDVVVCNPPYLPTEPDMERDDWLSVAVAGGPSGRAVVDGLLADVGRVLKPRGRLYLLASSLMDSDALRREATERGFDVRELARDESFPFEVLSVLCLERADD